MTTTKTGRSRRVSVGARTAALWSQNVATWLRRDPGHDESFGPWLFSARTDHQRRLPAATMGHWFGVFTGRCGHGGVSPHRLQHIVATSLSPAGTCCKLSMPSEY